MKFKCIMWHAVILLTCDAIPHCQFSDQSCATVDFTAKPYVKDSVV